MGANHICLICNGTGKDSQKRPCGLCSLKWKSTRITKREDLANFMEPNSFITHDPCSFNGYEKGWDLESNQAEANLFEAGKEKPLPILLKEIQEKLISIAARNAEQRAEFHSIAGVLEKYKETKDIAKFISDSYHGLRKAWLLIEKTERMVAERTENLK